VTTASVKPSYPLVPTVWIAVALTRRSAATNSLSRRTPETLGRLDLIQQSVQLCGEIMLLDLACGNYESQQYKSVRVFSRKGNSLTFD
jgi:hypothetical protein